MNPPDDTMAEPEIRLRREIGERRYWSLNLPDIKHLLNELDRLRQDKQQAERLVKELESSLRLAEEFGRDCEKEETALRQEVARLQEQVAEGEKQRDLAIAHDRQPYPTAWAYEQVCKALAAREKKEGELRRILEFYAEKARSLHRFLTVKKIDAVMAIVTELSLDNGVTAQQALAGQKGEAKNA